MSNIFTIDEMNWIKELVEEEVAKRKDEGDYEYWSGDKKVFESILDKIEKSK